MQVSLVCSGTGEANFSGCYPCRCPCHDDHRASLSVWETPRGVRVKCFAGCAPAAVKDAICELMQGMPLIARPGVPTRPKLTENELLRIVERIISDTFAIGGTQAEQRIRNRAITVELPPTLRFHPALYHHESGISAPAMVALVQTAQGTSAGSIHRTWIDTNVRRSLGPIRGHAVHLGQPNNRLIVGEGIETTLAAMQLWGPSFDGWAALSAPGVASLIIPDTITEIIIASDNDDAGRKAANGLRRRLLRERPTLKVTVYVPGNGLNDFNDALMAEAAA